MSYQLKVIKDNPIGFWMLDESSGTIAYDKSGCNNNGTYVGGIISNMLPLVPGGTSGNKITTDSYITLPVNKNYYSQTAESALANKNTSDNSFSLEIWVYPNILSSGEVQILADPINGTGIFWDNVGNVVFKLSNTVKLSHPINYTKKAIHVVATYNPALISLYVDGTLAATKSLSDFKFTNSTSSFQIGPTIQSTDYLIVDAPAIYRYELNDIVIKRHFVEGSVSKPAIQVVYPDEGILFSLNDMKIKPQFVYTYPKNRLWQDIADGENVYYDFNGGYITFYESSTPSAKEYIYQDSFTIPTDINLISSKIEWRNDYGVSVESSSDGTNWLSCINGEALPQYKKGSFASTGKVFIKIKLESSDITKFNPRLSFFAISFFSSKDYYADNFGDKIYSTNEYSLGSMDYPILSRNYSNGIRSLNEFTLNTQGAIKSIEMFYTPNGNGSFGLISATGTGYSWNSSGVVSKSNIDKVYVNGTDRTSATNISSWLTDGHPHHIIITFGNSITGNILFNNSSTTAHLYKNIAIYEKSLSQATVLEHYNLYTGKPSKEVSEPAITMTELDPKYYNNDWVVVQTI